MKVDTETTYVLWLNNIVARLSKKSQKKGWFYNILLREILALKLPKKTFDLKNSIDWFVGKWIILHTYQNIYSIHDEGFHCRIFFRSISVKLSSALIPAKSHEYIVIFLQMKILTVPFDSIEVITFQIVLAL